MKRLRKTITPLPSKCPEGAYRRAAPGAGVSYYMAGEYGTLNRRPHFHACLFNHQFTDKKYWKTTSTNSKLYTSAVLTNLWGKGFTSIGDVNLESAAYIARYIIAKITGHNSAKYYEYINEETGEIVDLKPEYNRMSLKTPIGKGWFEKYQSDVYPEGIVRTKKGTALSPRYYDKLYKKLDEEGYDELKKERERQAREYMHDNTPARLATKERVKRAQLNQLLRKI